MSTRRILRDRKKFFEYLLKKNPNDDSAKKVVQEINYILNSLKNYIYEDKG